MEKNDLTKIQEQDNPQMENRLWRRYREDKSSENRKSLSVFYLPFVRIIAGSIFSRLKLAGLEFSDYVSYGVVGLFDAIERFREYEPVRFKGYAAYRIKGEIYNGIVKFSDKAQFDAFKRRLANESLDSIHQEIKSSRVQNTDNFESIIELSSLLAIGEIINDDDMLENIENENTSPYPDAECESIHSRIISIVPHLEKSEMLVICYHYLTDLPFSDIAELLTLSKGRVSQIHITALKNIRILLNQKIGLKKAI